MASLNHTFFRLKCISQSNFLVEHKLKQTWRDDMLLSPHNQIFESWATGETTFFLEWCSSVGLAESFEFVILHVPRKAVAGGKCWKISGWGLFLSQVSPSGELGHSSRGLQSIFSAALAAKLQKQRIKRSSQPPGATIERIRRVAPILRFDADLDPVPVLRLNKWNCSCNCNCAHHCGYHSNKRVVQRPLEAWVCLSICLLYQIKHPSYNIWYSSNWIGYTRCLRPPDESCVFFNR